MLAHTLRIIRVLLEVCNIQEVNADSLLVFMMRLIGTPFSGHFANKIILTVVNGRSEVVINKPVDEGAAKLDTLAFVDDNEKL